MIWSWNTRTSFLDIIIKRNVNNLYPDVSNKVKLTDKGLFYIYSSFIPDAYKHNLIYCLVYRVFHIASSYSIFHTNLEVLKKKFLKIHRFLDTLYLPSDPTTSVAKKTIVLVLPYLGPLSIFTKRRLRKLFSKFYPFVNLKIVFNRGSTIKRLFSYKDKFSPKCSSGVVYQIQCEACGPSAAYVGKTINTLHERFYGPNGHLHPSTNGSALLEHLAQEISPNCEFNSKNIKILDLDQ